MKPSRSLVSTTLAFASATLLLAGLRHPLWQMRLEAPQYRDQEALNIRVHPDALRGDLRELRVLNQYIGVHVPPTLPQFQWLPAVLFAGAALAAGAGLLRRAARTRALLLISSALASALLIAALQAKTQMHAIGHNRDQKTVLAGVHDFTPPFLGTSRIAQFTVSSRFGTGAWLIGGALALQLGAAWMSLRPACGKAGNPLPTAEISAAPAFTTPSNRLTRSHA